MAAIEDGSGTHTIQSVCWLVPVTLFLYPSQSVVPSYFATFTLCLPQSFPVSLHLNFCPLPRFPIITSHLQGPLLRRASHLGARCDNRYLWHSPPGLLQSTPALLYLFPLALSRCIPPNSTTVLCLNVSNTFCHFALLVHCPTYLCLSESYLKCPTMLFFL